MNASLETVSQIKNQRRGVGGWDSLRLTPASPTQKADPQPWGMLDGEATVPVRPVKMTVDLFGLVCKGRFVGEQY